MIPIALARSCFCIDQARTRSRATEVGYFFPHGRDLAGFEPRTFRFQGFPEGRSGCERISPDPTGLRGHTR